MIYEKLEKLMTERGQKTKESSAPSYKINVEKLRFQKNSPKYQKMKKIESYIKSLCEAYSVLSNPMARALFDKFGFDELHSKWRFFLENCEGKACSPGGRYEEYIRSFVHENNHMSVERSQKKLEKMPQFESKQTPSAFTLSDIEVECSVTLKEVYQSKPITVEFQRKLMEPVSQLDLCTNVTKQFVLGANIFENRNVKFPGEGHHLVGKGCSDLIIKFNIIKDPNFAREGLNLVLKKKISLKEALTQHSFSIRHIDGSELDVTLSEILHPQKIVKFEGQGFTCLGEKKDLCYEKRFSFGLVPPNLAQIQKTVNQNKVFDFCYDPTFKELENNMTSVSELIGQFESIQNKENFMSKFFNMFSDFRK